MMYINQNLDPFRVMQISEFRHTPGLTPGRFWLTLEHNGGSNLHCQCYKMGKALSSPGPVYEYFNSISSISQGYGLKRENVDT